MANKEMHRGSQLCSCPVNPVHAHHGLIGKPDFRNLLLNRDQASHDRRRRSIMVWGGMEVATHKTANFLGFKERTGNKAKQMTKHASAARLHPPNIRSRSHLLTIGRRQHDSCRWWQCSPRAKSLGQLTHKPPLLLFPPARRW